MKIERERENDAKTEQRKPVDFGILLFFHYGIYTAPGSSSNACIMPRIMFLESELHRE